MTRRALLIVIIVILILIIAFYLFRKYVPGYFGLPVTGKITSPFGSRSAPLEGASTFHNGIDIDDPINTPIKPKIPGNIFQEYWDDHGGHSLIVEHAGGWKTGYAHLNGYGKFKVGDRFRAGDTIAYTGNSGNSTGPHLHFTLTNPQGIKVDPVLYIGKKLVA